MPWRSVSEIAVAFTTHALMEAAAVTLTAKVRGVVVPSICLNVTAMAVVGVGKVYAIVMSLVATNVPELTLISMVPLAGPVQSIANTPLAEPCLTSAPAYAPVSGANVWSAPKVTVVLLSASAWLTDAISPASILVSPFCIVISSAVRFWPINVLSFVVGSITPITVPPLKTRISLFSVMELKSCVEPNVIWRYTDIPAGLFTSGGLTTKSELLTNDPPVTSTTMVNDPPSASPVSAVWSVPTAPLRSAAFCITFAPLGATT